ncbi:MAG TPA: ABC transporter substrate-binding protein [Acidimicrobiales bacterium]
MRSLRLLTAGLVSLSVLSGVSLGTFAGAASTTPSLASCKTTMPTEEYTKGTLTVATDDPVYSPWFENNKPSNGKGYESALVYALASVLGIATSHVKWVYEPFDSSYTPGTKHFDFDINEISYTAARAKAVTFSASYYDVNQSIVALRTDKIVKAHSPAELKNYLYGDQIGTTGLAYINDYIKPTKSPRVFTTLDQAVEALQLGQIDAIVIDTPTGQYMASSQIVNSKNKLVATQVGQFPSVGEHYGLLFTKGNPLVACVNAGLAALTSNGTLGTLEHKWLGIYTSVPTLEP